MPRDTGSVLSRCRACHAQVLVPPAGERPDPMTHAPGCPLLSYRACDWCGGPLNEGAPSEAMCCQDRCRAARWKYRTGYDQKTRTNGRGRRANAQRKPDLRVAYRKTREALLDRIAHFPGGERLIDEALDSVLTDKQRKALHG